MAAVIDGPIAIVDTDARTTYYLDLEQVTSIVASNGRLKVHLPGTIAEMQVSALDTEKVVTRWLEIRQEGKIWD